MKLLYANIYWDLVQMCFKEDMQKAKVENKKLSSSSVLKEFCVVTVLFVSIANEDFKCKSFKRPGLIIMVPKQNK